MITSKMASKAQATVSQPVHAALGLEEGDMVPCGVEEAGVIPTNTASADGGSIGDLFATFSEWDSGADQKAYADL
jgi:antitoxin PrlF